MQTRPSPLGEETQDPCDSGVDPAGPRKQRAGKQASSPCLKWASWWGGPHSPPAAPPHVSAPPAGCHQALGTGPFFLPSCFPGTAPGPHGHLSGISRVPMEGEVPLLRPCTLAVCVVWCVYPNWRGREPTVRCCSFTLHCHSSAWCSPTPSHLCVVPGPCVTRMFHFHVPPAPEPILYHSFFKSVKGGKEATLHSQPFVAAFPRLCPHGLQSPSGPCA